MIDQPAPLLGAGFRVRSRVSDVFVCGLGPVVGDVAGVDQGQVAVWYVRVASVAGLEGVGDGEGFDCGGGGHGPIDEQPRQF